MHRVPTILFRRYCTPLHSSITLMQTILSASFYAPPPRYVAETSPINFMQSILQAGIFSAQLPDTVVRHGDRCEKFERGRDQDGERVANETFGEKRIRISRKQVLQSLPEVKKFLWKSIKLLSSLSLSYNYYYTLFNYIFLILLKFYLSY